MTAATGAWAQSATTTYKVDLNDGTQNPATWQGKAGDATDFGNLPLQGVAEGQAVTLKYNGRLKVKNVTATYAVPWDGDLSKLTAESTAEFATATDGMTITGTLAEGVNVKVSIADGATVTLDGATITGNGGCIRCLGEATIILKDGTTNTLTSSSLDYPALWIGDTGTMLTIQGNTGKLIVSSGSNCAGIGGGYANTNQTCGNIRIEGGVITAQGGSDGAGIGSDCNPATCGDIIITGGTVTATGGSSAAGIGSGYGGVPTSVCGNITIANTVTKVTATAGDEAPYSIGKGGGGNASCGTVTIGCTLDTNGNPIGGTKYWEDNAAVGDGATYLAQATIEYPAPVVDLSTLTADYVAKDGDVLTNATTTHKVEIADGATVTLDGVNISSSDYCIKCAGDATIILKDGSTNSLTSSSQVYPALWAGDAGTTLTIQGSTGVLNVTCGVYCAGIGGGYSNTDHTCGNIRIEGGVIIAQGGSGSAGIGSDCYPATCGDIIITGGTILATGGTQAAGIGGGYGSTSPSSCGNITITDGVTSVTATAGAYATYSIGKGDGGKASCGTIIIGCTLDSNGNPVGGTKYWENNAAVGDGATYLAQATIEYPAEEPVTLATPLTIKAITDGSILVNINGTLSSGMKYSVNGGTKTTITSTTVIGDLKAGDKVQFYGNGTQTQAYGNSPNVNILGSFDGFKSKVYGNIMSLLDETDYATNYNALPNAQFVFNGLFKNNATLIDARELLLPATQLAESCYRSMFENCTSLTKAPKLPATQLAAHCYRSMFQGCTILTSAYVKAAYAEGDGVIFGSMFNECTATGAVLHTTFDNKASWKAVMGTGKIWSTWWVADDWED